MIFYKNSALLLLPQPFIFQVLPLVFTRVKVENFSCQKSLCQRQSRQKLLNCSSPCCSFTSPTIFALLFHRYSEVNEPCFTWWQSNLAKVSKATVEDSSKLGLAEERGVTPLAKQAQRRKLTKQNSSKSWTKPCFTWWQSNLAKVSKAAVGRIPKYPIVYSILGEFKYRVLYISLVAVSLLLLLYLNIGLYLEFQSSYYLNYYQFIDFNWSEGIKELNQNNIYPNENTVRPSNYRGGLVDKNVDPIKRVTPIVVEIDEFKNFFISMVSYFSEQIKFLINYSGKNTSNILSKADTPQQLVFSVYIMSLFYQLVAFLGYHIFCFLCPAVIKQYRLKLFIKLEILFLILLLHFLALPYVLTIYQEFQIESLDSELFFSAHFDFLESWIKCFYFLLTVITLIALILFFSYPF